MRADAAPQGAPEQSWLPERPDLVPLLQGGGFPPAPGAWAWLERPGEGPAGRCGDVALCAVPDVLWHPASGLVTAAGERVLFSPSAQIRDLPAALARARRATPAVRIARAALWQSPGGRRNYGHFLFDGLTGLAAIDAAGLTNLFPPVSAALRPWQRDLLAAAGLMSAERRSGGAVAIGRLIYATTMNSYLNRAGALVPALAGRFGGGPGAGRGAGGAVDAFGPDAGRRAGGAGGGGASGGRGRTGDARGSGAGGCAAGPGGPGGAGGAGGAGAATSGGAAGGPGGAEGAAGPGAPRGVPDESGVGGTVERDAGDDDGGVVESSDDPGAGAGGAGGGPGAARGAGDGAGAGGARGAQGSGAADGAGGPGGAGGRGAVYLSRRGHAGRIVVNEAALERALAARGVRVVRPEALPVSGQIAMARGAAVLIGASGAGLANALFMAPGATVIELRPDRVDEPWMALTAAALGLRHRVVPLRSLDPAEVPLRVRLRQLPRALTGRYHYALRAGIAEILDALDAVRRSDRARTGTEGR